MKRWILAALITGCFYAGDARAEDSYWWRCAETGWACTKGFAYGFFIEGPCNIGKGCYGAGKEICLTTVDAGGMTYEICSGNRYKCKSGAGQYLEGGGSCGVYYRDFGLNVGTLGVYGQCQAGYQCYNGEISWDECSERIGGAACFQLVGARAIKCNAPQNSVWNCPVRQLPRHCAARISRKPTPFETRCGFQVKKNTRYRPPYILNERQLNRFCRTPGWNKCKTTAEGTPQPRCCEFALDADGSIYCVPSGRNTVGGALPPFKGCVYPKNAKFTTCSIWKGLHLCKNPKGGSLGGLRCHKLDCGRPVFEFMKPCSTGPFGGCKGLWPLQPRCIQRIPPPTCTNPWVPAGCRFAIGGACGASERRPVIWPPKPGAPPVIELPLPRREEIGPRRLVFPPAAPGTPPRPKRL